jgi:trimeric autotransporter adhesin
MSIIAAGTTTTTALSSTGNTDGTLQLQVNGTTPSVTLNTLGAIGVGSTPAYGSAGQVLTSNGSTSAAYWATPSAGGSAATPTALGTVFGKSDSGSPYSALIGYQAGANLTTGAENVAMGWRALYENITGSNNVAIGEAALNKYTASNNVAVGYQAAYNTTGTSITAIGHQALIANTTGTQNVALGSLALYTNTTASTNTAIGYYSMLYTTTGASNTAVGGESLRTNTTGTQNVAFGNNAMYSNSTGSQNVAVGSAALYNNTTTNNIAVGYQAAYTNTSGGNLVSVGVQAGYSNTTGNNNVAIGYKALYTGTTSNDTVCLGHEAGLNVTTGLNDIIIGTSNGGGLYRPVFDVTGQNNRIVMGHTSVSNAYIQVSWTVVSDARDKMNFAPVTHGLDFVNQLNPVSYQFKETRESNVPHGPVRYGFKAQEILALEGNNPVIIDTEDSEKLRYNGESLVPVLVKAIQELTARIAVLEGK